MVKLQQETSLQDALRGRFGKSGASELRSDITELFDTLSGVMRLRTRLSNACSSMQPRHLEIP